MGQRPLELPPSRPEGVGTAGFQGPGPSRMACKPQSQPLSSRQGAVPVPTSRLEAAMGVGRAQHKQPPEKGAFVATDDGCELACSASHLGRQGRQVLLPGCLVWLHGLGLGKFWGLKQFPLHSFLLPFLPVSQFVVLSFSF